MFVHTGDYIEHTSDNGAFLTYYTFTPRPLMGGNFYTMDIELAALLAETHRALGFIEGIVSGMCDAESVADLILFRESCFSKMIDYPDCDIRTLLMRREDSRANSDTQNIMGAYRYAMNTSVKKWSYDSILNRAAYGDNIKRKPAVRTEPSFLTKSTSNYRQYNPTAPKDIRRALTDIEKYIESDTSDSLIKAAMCHYQMEMVHPYYFYNGIVGRILPYHIMGNSRLEGIRFVSLSASLYRHKDEYFEKLELTQKSGNYAAWIIFFIHIILEAAQQSIAFLQYYTALPLNDEERILARPQDRSDRALDIYRYFRENVVSSIGQAGVRLNMSFSTVSRSVDILSDLGIVTQITKGARNRLFAHAGLFQRLVAIR